MKPAEAIFLSRYIHTQNTACHWINKKQGSFGPFWHSHNVLQTEQVKYFLYTKKVLYWHMIARRTFENGCFRIFLLEFFWEPKNVSRLLLLRPFSNSIIFIHIEYCYCKVLEIKLYFTLSTSGFPLKCHIASGVSLKSIGFCASLADVYFTMPGVTWVPSGRHCLSLLCKETGLSQVVLVAKAPWFSTPAGNSTWPGRLRFLLTVHCHILIVRSSRIFLSEADTVLCALASAIYILYSGTCLVRFLAQTVCSMNWLPVQS